MYRTSVNLIELLDSMNIMAASGMYRTSVNLIDSPFFNFQNLRLVKNSDGSERPIIENPFSNALETYILNFFMSQQRENKADNAFYANRAFVTDQDGLVSRFPQVDYESRLNYHMSVMRKLRENGVAIVSFYAFLVS